MYYELDRDGWTDQDLLVQEDDDDPRYMYGSRSARRRRAKPKNELLIYVVDWCGFCTKAKPEFNKVESTYEKKKKKNMGVGVKVKILNFETTKDAKEVKRQGDEIEGFPTIIFKDHVHPPAHYHGPLTHAHICAFVEEKLRRSI